MGRILLPILLVLTMFVGGCSNSKGEADFQTLADLNEPSCKIAAKIGTASEPYVGIVFPNAVEKQFPSMSDMVIALERKQVDGIVFTRATLESVMAEKPDAFKILDQVLAMTDIYPVVSPHAKPEDLKAELNEFLRAKKADGTLEKVRKYWVVDHGTEMPAIERAAAPTKKLIVGTMGTVAPNSFYVGDKLVGFDIELAERFAAAYGYEIQYRVEEFTSLLADTEFGKIDMIAGSVMYTEERAERVIFPDTPVYSLPVSVMTRKASGTETAALGNLFFARLSDSFEKTFIREDRYKMVLNGLQVTLVLAAGSLLLGTPLGFVFCMLKRSKRKWVSAAMEAFIALISGLPIVLTLMICFYIVFAAAGLDEIAIAIIAFAIDFGCYVAIILSSGMDSVAVGEIEAAQAMGMSNWQVLSTIVLPQAIQKTFGVYKRQVISLIKATSIVGYIAVQDLTKVSDLIRSRTYEAFFSLIFTAAIYFLIARICIVVLDLAESRLNRRKRNAA